METWQIQLILLDNGIYITLNYCFLLIFLYYPVIAIIAERLLEILSSNAILIITQLTLLHITYLKEN